MADICISLDNQTGVVFDQVFMGSHLMSGSYSHTPSEKLIGFQMDSLEASFRFNSIVQVHATMWVGYKDPISGKMFAAKIDVPPEVAGMGRSAFYWYYYGEVCDLDQVKWNREQGGFSTGVLTVDPTFNLTFSGQVDGQTETVTIEIKNPPKPSSD